MHLKSVFVLLTIACFAVCDASSAEIEARGKKKKIALFVFLADMVLKKFFILKLVYAFIFWVVVHKAGYFLAWFASYLKEQKNGHDHHDYHDYHGPHFEHGPNQGWGHHPYRRQAQGS